MAADQFLTKQMAVDPKPVMRVYHWRPWCISLGYHQKADCIDLDRCREGGIDVVRRQTGGRAVFHAEEITYSVVLPAGESVAPSVSQTYEQISQGLAAGLKKLGVPAEFQKRRIDLKSHYEKKISASCFSAAALHEIVVRGRKLVGSAQRRMPAGILQHGSILIGPAHHRLFRYMAGLSEHDAQAMQQEMSGQTTCMGDWVHTLPDEDMIARALKAGMAERMGIRFSDQALSQDEWQEIDKLRSEFSILKNV